MPIFAELSVYCYRVAGVVGRLIARILGFDNEQTLLYAEKQGFGFAADQYYPGCWRGCANGRIYLPQNELERFGIAEQAVLRAESSAEFIEFMNFQYIRAQNLYREARDLLPDEDCRRQKAGLIMAAIYYALLQEIRRDGLENVLRYKIAIPGPRKKTDCIENLVIWIQTNDA